MEDKTSIIKLIGLPEAFAVVLLTLGLILTLAPYFSGTDFGVFKIPQFTDPARKRLKIIGPIVLLVLIFLSAPMMPRARVNTDNANRIDIHNQVQQHIANAKDLYNHAKYDEAINECDEALRLEPANQEAIQLREKVRGSKDISNQNSRH